MSVSPLWSLFNTVLTLLALLATLGASEPPEVVEYRRDHDDADYGSGAARYCDPKRRPSIAATSASESSFRVDEQVLLNAPYLEDVILLCSASEASNLTIRDSEKKLQAKHLNSTTMHVSLRNLDVREHNYYCTDTNNQCTDTLTIDVTPALAVIAPGVNHTLDTFGPVYFVPRGEHYEVFCTANEVEAIHMRVELDYLWQDLTTKILNQTTITATVTDDTEGRSYACYFRGRGVIMRTIVDNYPEAFEFQCIWYQRRKIRCYWSSSSTRNTFKLYILNDQGRTLLCSDNPGGKGGSCDGAYSAYNDIFNFHLQTCNEVFCGTQTFPVDSESILKLDPVYKLQVINASSLGAVVSWRHSYTWVWYCEYKVEYRLLGTEWRFVNVSSVHCHANEPCELQMALPCPDAHYELRVYVRPEGAKATEARKWSDPVSVFFFTAPSTGGEVVPACGAEFREPEPTLSVAVTVLHEVRELISDDRKMEPPLKKIVSSMKQKLGKIKALINAQP